MQGECGTWERNGQQQRQETGETVEAREKQMDGERHDEGVGC